MPESPVPRFDGWQSQDGYREMLSFPCFFAAVPDDIAKPEILRAGEHLAREHGLVWSKVGQRNPHVSLLRIEKLIRVNAPPATILHALSKLNVAAFNAVFVEAVSYDNDGNNYPFVLRANDETIENFRVLGKEISRAMRLIGIHTPYSASFDPHVTLRYSKASLPTHRFTQPIRWSVCDIVLIRSHFGFATHETLSRWPLRNQQ